MSMPAVPITSREQYIKAFEVLDRVGGTFQGVGSRDRFLLVSEAQYKALVEADVVSRKTAKRTPSMARTRASAASFEEMLQTLQASFQRRLAPPLGGFVYRFTLFLPLLSEG
jgi:hypothetical protein